MEMRIIVATDGEPAALGALRVGRALAARHRASVEVVSVVPPFPLPPRRVGGPEFIAVDGLDRAACNAARNRVLAQLSGLGAECNAWATTVAIGPPAQTILRVARERNASLIVIGQGRHALADRWLGTETALRVIRLSHVPVLVVPANAEMLPERGVAAVDFSDFSRDAARVALTLLRPDGVLRLVHVFWRPSEEIPWVGGHDWVETLKAESRRELDEMTRALGAEDERRVQAELREGDPAGEVLRLAAELDAGLIAAGSHGAGFLGRVLIGSVPKRLVRAANCMVLVAPLRAVPAELEALAAEALPRLEGAASASAPATR
jgi:nucleotide-binding universal stress UspA family protein